MYQAAIVEDEELFLQSTKKLLADTFSSRNVPVAFDFFLSGTQFLPMIEQHFHYDMIFLDIEMPQIDGISVCRRIRQIAPDALVVFISNKDSLVFQTFEVQPFRFIRKSELKELVSPLVDAIIGELSKRDHRIVRFEEPGSGDVFSFDISKIKYVEAQRKDCVIHTKEGASSVRIKFMNLEEMLIEYNFIKIHRSFLVNADEVSQIKKESVLLTTGEELPLSRSLREQVKQEFLNHSMH